MSIAWPSPRATHYSRSAGPVNAGGRAEAASTSTGSASLGAQKRSTGSPLITALSHAPSSPRFRRDDPPPESETAIRALFRPRGGTVGRKEERLWRRVTLRADPERQPGLYRTAAYQQYRSGKYCPARTFLPFAGIAELAGVNADGRRQGSRDAVGNGPLKLKLLKTNSFVALNLADEAADQRAVRAARRRRPLRHLLADEADAHVGVRRMAGPSSNSRSSAVARLPPCRWRSPRRFSNYQPRIAQRDSASCICRKSTGGFSLQVE